MYNVLLSNIKNLDQFGFNPENALSFNKKQNFKTLTGGIYFIFLSSLLLVMWYQNFYKMFFYLGDTVGQNETAANMIERGKVKMSQMKSTPFIAPYYKG